MIVDAPKTILIYVNGDLVGDGLMKLPFLRAMRSAFPQAHITWLSGFGPTVYATTLAPLVKSLLDDARVVSFKDFVRQHRKAGTGFDLIVDTQRRFRLTWALRGIRHQRFVSSTLGYWLSDARPKSRSKLKSLSKQLHCLAELAAGHPVAPDAPLVLPESVLAEAARLLPDGPTYVGLAPGAGGKHKCWPLTNYLELARRLNASGRAPVFLLGPDEAGWEASIRAELPDALLPVQQASQVSPALTIALGQKLAAAIANDSGVGHMMAAADIPLLSLFGPTSPVKFSPVAARLTVLRAQDFGSDQMEVIPVDAVERALGNLLGAVPKG